MTASVLPFYAVANSRLHVVCTSVALSVILAVCRSHESSNSRLHGIQFKKSMNEQPPKI